MKKTVFILALALIGLSANAQTLQSGSFLTNLPELKTATKTADGIYTVEIQPLQVTNPSTNQTVEYALNETGDFYDPAATVWQDSPVFPAHATTGAVYLLARSKKNATHAAGVIYHHAVYLDGKCNCSLGLTLPPVVPPVPVSSISLNKTALTLLTGDSEQLIATVLPANAADKTVTWQTSDAIIATVSADGTVTAVAIGIATITATAGGKTAICTVTVPDPLTYDPGVVINGVKWATRNVDEVGTFAATPESAGKFYQWNRKKAWSATEPPTGAIPDWDFSTPGGTEWTAANDPSPAGWRVPTFDEIKTLLDDANVTSKWGMLNGVAGRGFTDKNNSNSVFFPAVGYRGGYGALGGSLVGPGNFGDYWSSSQGAGSYASTLLFSSVSAVGYDYDRRDGFNVRAVAE